MPRRIKNRAIKSGKAGKLEIFVTYKKFRFLIPSGIYQPNYDSIFLLENAGAKKRDSVLDLGTGCGFFAINLADQVKKILAVDSSFKAIDAARHNAKINGLKNALSFRKSDMFSNVKGKFDLILCDPPQIPTPHKIRFNDLIESAVDGGADGRVVIDKVIEQSTAYLNKNGRLVLYHSELAGIEKTFERMKSVGMSPKIVAREEGPFGRTTRERLGYYKKLGIKIKYKKGVPLQRYYIVSGVLKE